MKRIPSPKFCRHAYPNSYCEIENNIVKCKALGCQNVCCFECKNIIGACGKHTTDHMIQFISWKIKALRK